MIKWQPPLEAEQIYQEAPVSVLDVAETALFGFFATKDNPNLNVSEKWWTKWAVARYPAQDTGHTKLSSWASSEIKLPRNFLCENSLPRGLDLTLVATLRA